MGATSEEERWSRTGSHEVGVCIAILGLLALAAAFPEAESGTFGWYSHLAAFGAFLVMLVRDVWAIVRIRRESA